MEKGGEGGKVERELIFFIYFNVSVVFISSPLFFLFIFYVFTFRKILEKNRS